MVTEVSGGVALCIWERGVTVEKRSVTRSSSTAIAPNMVMRRIAPCCLARSSHGSISVVGVIHCVVIVGELHALFAHNAVMSVLPAFVVV